jgi:hypothetical protein
VRFLVILLAVSCFATPEAFAQQDFGRMEILLQGALLTHSFSGLPDEVSTEGEWGAQAGAAIRIGSPFYLESGFEFAGAAYTVTGVETFDGFEEELEDVLGHLGWRIPVLVGYRLMPGSPLKIRLFAGVAPLFITQVEEESDFELTKDDYESTVWNASLGAGLDVLFISASLFYEAGLSNLFTEEAVGDTSADVKLSGFGGRLGIRLAI